MQTIPTSMRTSATVGNETKLGEICWHDSSTGLSGEYGIRSAKCTIGSHPSSTIVLPENIAAATHLTLTFGKRFTLLKAPYPTRIKGRLVREWLIDEPIEFCIGTCLFQLVPTVVAFKATSVVRAHQLVATANRLSEPLPPQPVSRPVPVESSSIKLGAEAEAIVKELSVSDFERTLSRFDSIESSLDQLRSSLGQIQEAVDKVPIDSLNVSKSLAEEFSQLSHNLTLQISTELRSQFEQRLDEQEGVWNDALKDGVHLLESRIENLALKVESLGEMQGNLEETAMNAEIRQATSMEHRFAGIESRLDEFANRLVEASDAKSSETSDLSGEVWKAEFECRFQELRSQRDEIYHALESVRNDVQEFGSVAQCNFEYLLQQLQAIPREGQLLPAAENEYQNAGSEEEASAYRSYANESYDNESYASPESSPYREELSVDGIKGSLSDPSLDAYQESMEYSPESQGPSETESQSYHSSSNPSVDPFPEFANNWQVPSWNAYTEDRPYAEDDYALENAVQVDESSHGNGTPADLEVGEYIDSLSHSVAEKHQNESPVYPDSEPERDNEPERDYFLRPNLDAYDGGYDYASRLADSEQGDEPEILEEPGALLDDPSSADPEVDIEALSARLRRMLSHPGGRSEANDANGSRDDSMRPTTQERRSEPFSGFGSPVASNVWTGESVAEQESLAAQSHEERGISREDRPISNESSQAFLLEQFLRENSESQSALDDSPSYAKSEYIEPAIQENPLKEEQAFDARRDDDRYDDDRYKEEQGGISRVDMLADSIALPSPELLDHVPLRQVESPKASATMVEPMDEARIESSLPTEDEDSIEAYMQKLLQRVKGGSDTHGLPALAPQTESKNTPRSRSEFLNRSSRDTTTAPATEPAVVPKASMMTEEEFVPRQQAPEKKNELDALRELANSNARRAITRSESKRMNSAILLKVAITAFALAAAMTLLAINGLNINPPFAGMVAALIVAFLWGYDCVTHFHMLGSVKASETKENDRTSALEHKSSQQQWRPKAD